METKPDNWEMVKHKARLKVWRAKYKRKLIPKPCADCGRKKVDAHHWDYDKPLDVVWLCRSCHMKEHGRIRRLDRAEGAMEGSSLGRRDRP